MTPRLLVSVRDAGEALAAIRGGADIVDVKEPAHGSLGMAAPDALASVLDAITAESPGTPLSAALGELVDWFDPVHRPRQPDLLPRNALQQGWTWVKAGLAGTATGPDCDPALLAGWQRVIRDLSGRSTPPTLESSHPGWVAVAYVDWERARCPSPASVLSAARELGCAAFLLDTWRKDESTLLDWMSESALCEVRDRCIDSKLPIALAGRLDESHFPLLRRVAPDIVAVRGAVCDRGQRVSRVSEDRVASLQAALRTVFAEHV